MSDRITPGVTRSDYLPPLRPIAPEHSPRIGVSHGETHVRPRLEIHRIEVVVLGEARTLSPVELHPLRAVRPYEPGVGGGEVVVHLDALREGVDRLEDIDVVVCSAGLQDTLQNAVSVVPLLAGEMQRERHDVDQETTVVLGPHDLDRDILE